MPATITQVIASFRQVYPQCDTTRAQTFFETIHKRILAACKLRQKTEDITLTADQREYDLPSGAMRIFAAHYVTSSSDDDFHTLIETSEDDLDVRDPDWRRRTNSGDQEPEQYYITSATDTDSAKPKIGFLETPPTSTSGGYPKVVLSLTSLATLSGSETIPSNLLDEEVYVSGMAMLYAKRQDKENYQGWRQAFRDDLSETIEFVKNLLPRENTELSFDHIRSAAKAV